MLGGLLAAALPQLDGEQGHRPHRPEYREGDALVRLGGHQAPARASAQVITWVLITIVYVMVTVEVTDSSRYRSGLVAPATVLGAALGFGAQRVVQDILAGFFIITERQYGFGDVVSITVAGIAAHAEGTVEDVTLARHPAALVGR